MRLVSVKCPYCNHEGMPYVEKRLTTGAWVLFAVLVFVCFPLCWIPFVVDGMKEEIARCQNCGLKLN
ncbi:hypothetical protein EYV94_04815 [Puteibacter caeruleilacunae]|nr:hypothetical protein EYV94_04815 [Puteibacter caeruleilacunae]